MNTEIQNFRGIKRATFSLKNVVLIGANNNAGKSSIVQALGALLTGNPVPVSGVTKATAGQLVHAGTAAGSASLTTEEGNTALVWPKAVCTTEGAPPYASPFAAGLECVLAMSQKDRAKALAFYLAADPTREDLEAGLKGLGLSADQVGALWEMIETGGWDSAHERVKAKGAKLKGQWEQITSKRYGSKIAANYVPDAWEPNLEGESEEPLNAAVVDARELLEAAIANDAIDEDRRGELATHAANIPEIEKQQAEAAKAVTDASEAEKKACVAANALPMAGTKKATECPHCQGPLEFTGGKIVKAVELTTEEVAKREADYQAAGKVLTEAIGVSAKASSALNGLNSDLRMAQNAANELAAMPEATTQAGANIDQARAVLRTAEERLQAWKSKTMADQRANSIAINVQIVDALKPAGIRQKKLAKAMSTANAELATVTDVAKSWGVVTLDGDLEASLNGTPYKLLSKSERYRCRVALQVWQAVKDNSAAVVIDGADMLVDRPLRNDLFKVLAALNVPAVVTMAMPERGALPDLEAAGVGQSYWIEAGELQPR